MYSSYPPDHEHVPFTMPTVAKLLFYFHFSVQIKKIYLFDNAVTLAFLFSVFNVMYRSYPPDHEHVHLTTPTVVMLCDAATVFPYSVTVLCNVAPIVCDIV
jgi:hypothetical protein